MNITVLAENTSAREDLRSEHGLSLYMETARHKLLFDAGSGSLFAENAQKLGVDLGAVDIAVISHGHYDHGGGLETFLHLNDHAPIYCNARAFQPHYSNRKSGEKAYIGLDPSLLPNERFRFCGDDFVIDDELTLFAGVTGETLLPAGNVDLFVKTDGEFRHDDFVHEQNLIISEGGKTILVAGCAHRGILNILARLEALLGHPPDAVIGGFHLYNRGADRSEDPRRVEQLGKILLDSHAWYFTCHCTGPVPYAQLRAVMGETISYIATGDRFTI